MTELVFDWHTETTRKGTMMRVGQFVRGTCAHDGCREGDDALLYDAWDDSTLLCAHHTRIRSMANPREETCDEEGCGAGPAWRDPVTRVNEFFCATHHAKHGAVFQNRWGGGKRDDRIMNLSIGMHKAVCAAAGYGTECKGEIKWRGKYDKSLCNKHAGVKSANEANN